MSLTPLGTENLVLTLGEVQSILRIRQTALYRRIARGEIEARKLGGRTVIYRTELQRYIDHAPPLNATIDKREGEK